VTLFGSRARGDARKDSDWDLLVLIEKDELSSDERSDYIYPLFSLGWELNIEINPIIYTTKSWKEQSITPFYKNVVNEGIVIWH
jgi:predicted nucleotidyltransferase